MRESSRGSASLFGKPSAAELGGQGERSAHGSLHLRTLRPSSRRICSCDLDACCCCSPRCLSKVSVPWLSSRVSSYTGAQCPVSSCCADPIPLALPCAVARGYIGLPFHPPAWKVKPSATCHHPPLSSLFARFPEPGRRCLNLISTRSSAPIRPKGSPSCCIASLCRSQPIVTSFRPLLSRTPSRIQSDGAPICGTDAHDITTVVRFRLSIYTVEPSSA